MTSAATGAGAAAGVDGAAAGAGAALGAAAGAVGAAAGWAGAGAWAKAFTLRAIPRIKLEIPTTDDFISTKLHGQKEPVYVLGAPIEMLGVALGAGAL